MQDDLGHWICHFPDFKTDRSRVGELIDTVSRGDNVSRGDECAAAKEIAVADKVELAEWLELRLRGEGKIIRIRSVMTYRPPVYADNQADRNYQEYESNAFSGIELCQKLWHDFRGDNVFLLIDAPEQWDRSPHD